MSTRPWTISRHSTWLLVSCSTARSARNKSCIPATVCSIAAKREVLQLGYGQVYLLTVSRCRRKDTNKPMYLPDTSVMSPPPTAPTSPRAILTASTPTGASYMDYPSIRIPADHHNAKSDLDPTEWKPKGKRDLRNSEAHRYLSQFHRSSTSALDDNEKISTARPFMHRSHASMTSMMTTPSLASTPTTATSSLSIDYDFNTRALPPRHNPMYSASAGSTKDIGLVTPHMVPETVGSVPGDGSWEKKPVAKRAGGDLDGLLSKSMGK